MIRGTTPRLEFTLPFETSVLATAWVTFSQKRKEILSRELQSCECNGKTLVVRLTQEETLKLSCGCETEIQIRARTVAGDVLASEIFKVFTDRILKEGVI